MLSLWAHWYNAEKWKNCERGEKLLMRKISHPVQLLFGHWEYLLKFRVLQIWNVDPKDLKLRNTSTVKIKIPLDLQPLVKRILVANVQHTGHVNEWSTSYG